MEYNNIPQSVIKSVKEQTNTTQKEKEEILKDLELNYIKKKERDREHEENMKNNPSYRRLWESFNQK